jgi:hypothetical protein
MPSFATSMSKAGKFSFSLIGLFLEASVQPDRNKKTETSSTVNRDRLFMVGLL